MLRRLFWASAIALAVILPVFIHTPIAHSYTLGVGDRADAPVASTQGLGARVYRVVIDPDLGLASYDARIYAHRRAGQEPQLVIGGTGTRRHANRWGLARAAVAAFKRWPFAYSVSVVNEPDLSGMSACGYARTYARAYRMLRALGARVLFGEWSPYNAVGWTGAILKRCGLHLRVDGYAWHGYDAGDWEGAIYNTRKIAAQLRRWAPKLGGMPRLYVTEYSVATRGPWAVSEATGVRRWRQAIRIARAHLQELVAWDVTESPGSSSWGSDLVQSNGRPRPAYHLLAAAVKR